jgi:hypothetical protein
LPARADVDGVTCLVERVGIGEKRTRAVISSSGQRLWILGSACAVPGARAWSRFAAPSGRWAPLAWLPPNDFQAGFAKNQSARSCSATHTSRRDGAPGGGGLSHLGRFSMLAFLRSFRAYKYCRVHPQEQSLEVCIAIQRAYSKSFVYCDYRRCRRSQPDAGGDDLHDGSQLRRFMPKAPRSVAASVWRDKQRLD